MLRVPPVVGLGSPVSAQKSEGGILACSSQNRFQATYTERSDAARMRNRE
jgi:hypothetical protein